jgi:hypothetical protein
LLQQGLDLRQNVAGVAAQVFQQRRWFRSHAAGPETG